MKWKSKKSQDRSAGFTIVELLIVIVGILAAIVILTLPRIVDRSKGAVIATSIQQTRRALLTWHVGEGFTNWLTEADMGYPTALVPAPHNPRLQDIIDEFPDLHLNDYLSKANNLVVV